MKERRKSPTGFAILERLTKNGKEMAKKTARVVIPRNPDELIDLGEGIIEKHNEDPATSPIAGLDMAEFEQLVLDAKKKNAEAKKLRKDAETATEDRDSLLGHRKDQNSNTLGTVLNYVSRSRDILLGNFRGTEQHLGDYGFVVNKSSGTTPSEPENPTP
jgi:hypothetical protein